MSRSRRRFRLLLMASVAALLPLLLLEGVLRLVDPFHAAEAIDRERFAGAALRSETIDVPVPGGARELPVIRLRAGCTSTLLGHQVVIGSDGLRNPPTTVPKPDDVYRILMLGDSVVFGWGVAESDALPRVVERLLREQDWPGDGRRVEVVNAGVPGWGAMHELVWLQQQGLAMEPDMVLVTLINNDLTDVLQILAPEAPVAPLLAPRLLRGSYLVRFLEQAVASLAERRQRPEFFVELDLAPELVQQASSFLCVAYGQMRAACGSRPFAVVDTIGDGAGWRVEPFVQCSAAGGLERIEAFLPKARYAEDYAVAAVDLHPNARGHLEMAERVVGWVLAQPR